MSNKPTQEMIQLLKASTDRNATTALEAQYQLVKALELPLRQGTLVGDIVGDIFESFPGNDPVRLPLDIINPGQEDEFYAYTIPQHGYIPTRHVEADYVMVPSYSIGNAIDCDLQLLNNANWDVVARMTSALEAGIIAKRNDDSWHVLLAAGADRNIIVYDSDASAGQFTKRVVSLGKLVMTRNAGGNTSSIKRGKLTDLYCSPENVEDMRNWGVDIVDEITRREIFVSPDGSFNRIFGVNIHSLDELGQGAVYQDYFTNELSGSLASGDVELMVGLDLLNKDAFVNPVVEPWEMFNDPALHRSQQFGMYGWLREGRGVLDGRRVLLLSC